MQHREGKIELSKCQSGKVQEWDAKGRKQLHPPDVKTTKKADKIEEFPLRKKIYKITPLQKSHF